MVGRIVIVKWLSEVRRNSAPQPYFSTRVTPPVLLTVNPAPGNASSSRASNRSSIFHIPPEYGAQLGAVKAKKGAMHLQVCHAKIAKFLPRWISSREIRLPLRTMGDCVPSISPTPCQRNEYIDIKFDGNRIRALFRQMPCKVMVQDGNTC